MPRKPHIALVTCQKLPDLSPDDRVLQAALGREGAVAAGVVWDDRGVDWSAFDVAVVRSTWDYHLRLDDFRQWIDARERDRSHVLNRPIVLRWNSEKTYLAELERAGVPVVPTAWVPKGSSLGLREVSDVSGWREIVVKPIVSASAHGTWRTRVPFAPDSERRFREELHVRSLMVQPLLPQVAEHGELSLMFIGGRFSHAVRKRPRVGDFRVQREHGGSATLVQPGDAIIDAAARALAASPASTLYARVDGCEVDDTFLLMELELLEPSLFFTVAPAAATDFAREILQQLGGNST